MALTDTRIRTAKPAAKPFKITDSAGLHLEVRPTGSKLWRYRYRIAGRENLYALGEYPALSLAEARSERDKARKLVKQGIHPSHNRQALLVTQVAENANTFEAVGREWVERNKGKWSDYYLKQVEGFLRTDVYPYVGQLPIRSVSAAHILAILKRVEKRAPTVALLLRQWCSAIFRYAVSTLRADVDPCFALKGAISKPKVEHHKPLSRNEIPKFLDALAKSGGYRTTVIALRLLLLLFVRPIELRASTWSEFDLDGAEWRIPPERMKMRELHIVPLPKQAVDLLRELKELTGGRPLLLPNYRRPKTFMTATTLNRALERMGYGGGRFTSHGFRATASTILNEMGFRVDVIERQLAHKERNQSRASYNRAEYLAERREMIQTWANYLDSIAVGDNEKIVPMRRAK